jgi:hydrogenase expression/formation protein HypE
MQGPVCAVPLPHTERIVMGHGSGGRMTHDLIKRVFLPRLGNSIINEGNDAAAILDDLRTVYPNRKLVFSTDSHVVSPLFFAGGDIGRLAVCGTVNDVAMMGAKPLYLTAGFILEEGLDIRLLEKVVDSMRTAADEAGIQIIAGDTKVVQKGKADGLYITTTGFGVVDYPGNISGANAQPGDVVILSGTLGDHGISVLVARDELGFSANICSDVAPLNHLVSEILQVSEHIHVLRDPTRGGLATTMNEIANQSQVSIVLNEAEIPVKPVVAGACEMLGFDPLYVANEGKLIVIVAEKEASKVLNIMQRNQYGTDSIIIGEVKASTSAFVLLKTPFGSTRILDMLSGEMLPRIC